LIYATCGRVLIPGGAGFIGSHTIDAKLQENVQTLVLDGLSTGAYPTLADHKRDRLLHFVKETVSNLKTVTKLTTSVEADGTSECVEKTHCCILVAEWGEFKELTAASFAEEMNRPIATDGRRVHDVNLFRKAGTSLLAVGLGRLS
jgi:UDP-glucose 6-dehydrogenase